MKRLVGLGIAGLAALVFVWGVVAACCAYINANPKQYVVSAVSSYNYARDGRQMVSYKVPSEDTERYVQWTGAESVNQVEYYRRTVKNRAILVSIAKKTYEADMTDANLISYNKAIADLTAAKEVRASLNTANFIRISSAFFGTYFPIIAFCGIAFLINLKIEYKKDKK